MAMDHEGKFTFQVVSTAPEFLNQPNQTPFSSSSVGGGGDPHDRSSLLSTLLLGHTREEEKGENPVPISANKKSTNKK